MAKPNPRVSRETYSADVLAGLEPHQIELLKAYEGLLAEFAPRVGLIGPGETSMVWERHILDSLRARRCLARGDPPVLDLGSGAGLPGLPLAVAFPEYEFVLLEPARRRLAFLELVLERLALRNVSVQAARAEKSGTHGGVCVARAFAPPVRTWLTASGLLNPGGFLLYYAGRSWSLSAEQQLSEAGAVSEICEAPKSPWQGPIVAVRAGGSARRPDVE
jgi:16S rRNA (guanine527-N7)-methyltransferase